MIKAVIVDDEPPARREMRRLLAEHADITVAGEAADLATARGLVLRTSPDLVFLDIRLGQENGFNLLGDLDPETSVIFVTAYDSFAIKAFDANALDYLIKPVEAKRLSVSLERAHAVRKPSSAEVTKHRVEAAFSTSSWIYLDAGETPQFLRIPTISFIEASGGGSILHTVAGKSVTVPRPLSAWEQRLGKDNFVRVHRSILVNLEHVEEIERWFHYSYRVHIRGAVAPVPMSRRYAAMIRGRLG